MEEDSKRRGTFDAVSDTASRIILFVSRPGIPNVIAGLGPIVLSVVGVIFFLALVIIITGGGVGTIGDIGTGTTPSPAPIAGIPPGGIGGYITQCAFSGPSGGLQIGNQNLAVFIREVAQKVDVPSPVLAGIARIESPDKFVNKSDEFFQNDYDATTSNKGAVGFMQFLPSTFEGVFTQNKDVIQSNFNKSGVKVDIEPPTATPPNDEILRITSIKDSIIMAAYKIKGNKDAKFGSGAPWEENVVRYVAERYQGACPYSERTNGNYCDDLWESVRRCEFDPIASVLKIHDAVNEVCPTGVSGGRNGVDNVEDCIANLPKSLPKIETIKNIIRSSARYAHPGELVLQCVGFVETAVEAANFPTLLTSKKREAKLYADSPYPSTYQFISRGSSPIQPGDIPIWRGPASSGHIAFVVGVIDTETFRVAEANYCEAPQYKYPCGRIGLRNEYLNNGQLAGWLRKN